MNVRECRKENVKVLMENWLIKFIWLEMWILHAKFLIKHSRNMYRYFCFAPNLIQIIIDIVMLNYGPNINMELCKTFLQEFLQSMLDTKDVRCTFSISTLFKACGD
jgi:hypothetical protein